jgi:hypothetical protein
LEKLNPYIFVNSLVCFAQSGSYVVGLLLWILNIKSERTTNHAEESRKCLLPQNKDPHWNNMLLQGMKLEGLSSQMIQSIQSFSYKLQMM